MTDTHYERAAAISNLTTVCLQEALLAALTELAKTHHNEPGDWLDRLETEALESAKGASLSGPSAEIDAAALKDAHHFIREVFSDLRSSLEEE